ncbi:MAG: hypothetical protein U0840_30790 [Gemmataceae bacterium]
MPTLPKLPPIAGQPISLVLLHEGPSAPVPDESPLVAAWRAYLTSQNLEHDVTVVAHPDGIGAALREGLAGARHPLVCYAPLDASYPPEFLGLLLARQMTGEEAPPGPEIDHVHIMSGFRAGRPVPLPLRLLGALWRGLLVVVLSYAPPRLPGWLGLRRHFGTWLAGFFFGVRYRDPACPFRLIRRDILARIPIQSTSALAHVELIAKANFLGAMLSEEVPLPVDPGACSESTRRIFAEARRLFQRPDFGPVVLPEPAHQSV